ncbi:MAG: hypothetical protein ACHBN1_16355 [Heteroscytonema crispum UTEX LB 1556]
MNSSTFLLANILSSITTNPFGVTLVGTLDYSKGASLSLPRSAEPVAWVGKPSRSTRFTTNHQPPTTNH